MPCPAGKMPCITRALSDALSDRSFRISSKQEAKFEHYKIFFPSWIFLFLNLETAGLKFASAALWIDLASKSGSGMKLIGVNRQDRPTMGSEDMRFSSREQLTRIDQLTKRAGADVLITAPSGSWQENKIGDLCQDGSFTPCLWLILSKIAFLERGYIWQYSCWCFLISSVRTSWQWWEPLCIQLQRALGGLAF